MGFKEKLGWDKRWRGGTRWTGWAGRDGIDAWRDDVPQ